MFSVCSQGVCWASGRLRHQPAFCVLIRPLSCDPCLQLFDMQQAAACSVWPLQLSSSLITTRSSTTILQPSFVCRPDPGLWQSGSTPLCGVIWSLEGIKGLATERRRWFRQRGRRQMEVSSFTRSYFEGWNSPDFESGHFKKLRNPNWIDAVYRNTGQKSVGQRCRVKSLGYSSVVDHDILIQTPDLLSPAPGVRNTTN